MHHLFTTVSARGTWQLFLKHFAPREARPRHGKKWPYLLGVETLEDRIQLAAWTFLGPAPQLDGSDYFGTGGGNLSGRVSALA
jgi:hypothetical protein